MSESSRIQKAIRRPSGLLKRVTVCISSQSQRTGISPNAGGLCVRRADTDLCLLEVKYFSEFSRSRADDGFNVERFAYTRGDIRDHLVALRASLGLIHEAAVFEGQGHLLGDLFGQFPFLFGP